MSLFKHKKKDDEEDPKQTIEKLQKDIEKLRQENSEQGMLMQDTIITKDKEIKEFKAEIKSLKDKIKNAPNEETINGLNKKIEDLEQEKSALMEENLKNKKAVKIIESEKARLEEEKENLEKEVEVSKNKVEHFINEKNDLEREIDRLKREIEKKEEQMQSRQNENLSQLLAEKEEAEKDSKNYLSSYQKVRQELKELQQKYDEEKVKNELKFMEIQRNLDEKNSLIQKNLEEKKTLIQRSNEEKKILMQKNFEEKQSLIQKNIEEKNKKEELLKLNEDSEYTHSLAEILSDYLVKTNSNKFSLSMFDLFQLIIININLFDEIYENCDDIENSNEIPLLLYAEINRFLHENLSRIDDIKLNDFLSNSKLIMQSNYDKNIVELIKKVKIFNDRDPTIFETYKKKKDLFNKITENNFDLIKKFIQDKIKTRQNYSLDTKLEVANKYIEYNEATKTLSLNFRQGAEEERTKEIKSLILYIIKEKISKVESFKMSFTDESSVNEVLFFIYFMKFYNNKLASLTINFEKFESEKPLVKFFQEKLYIIISILPELKELHLVNFNILQEGQESSNLLKVLTNSKIEKLTLCNCLTKYSSFYISEYLAKAKIMAEINCCDHKIEGMISSFIPYLQNLPNLTVLNISNNLLNQEDFEGLGNFMQNENHLKYINLSNVKMTFENCNSFGLGLRKIKNLETLILSNCNITAESFNFVINRNTPMTLKKIVFDYNKIGDAGINGISSYVRGNQNFKYLSVKDCGFSLIGFSLMKALLGASLLKDAEIHVEENSLIENSDLPDQFGKDTTLQERGIKIYISKTNLSDRIVEKLKKFSEIVIV